MKYIETSPKRLKTTFDSLILLIALIVFSQQKDSLKQGAPFEEFLINIFAPIQSGITSAHTKALSFFNDVRAQSRDGGDSAHWLKTANESAE